MAYECDNDNHPIGCQCPGILPPNVINAAHIDRQRGWSEKTFGPYPRLAGVVDHIRKELIEVVESDGDLSEWIDVLMLAFDGACGSGASSQEIIDALVAKLEVNEARTWPDWRTADRSRAIEHDRSGDAFVQAGPVSIYEDGAVIQA